MNPKQRGFLIEEILNNSDLSIEERANLIFDHICQTSEDEDEKISSEYIKKTFKLMSEKTFSDFRISLLIAIAEDKSVNIFAINRNLLRMNFDTRCFTPDPRIEQLVRAKLKIPVSQ